MTASQVPNEINIISFRVLLLKGSGSYQTCHVVYIKLYSFEDGTKIKRAINDLDSMSSNYLLKTDFSTLDDRRVISVFIDLQLVGSDYSVITVKKVYVTIYYLKLT